MKTITTAELADRLQEPLIDVRERDEFAQGHIPGAVNIPMSELRDRQHELPDGAMNVVCLAGGRSARVVQALEAEGYDMANVEGGTQQWVAEGRELEHPTA
ncbi:rhodanese-like domain-containing protein [Microbacterium resistens]|uniref:rhodanese-like domain-containing protein n=1 Tax=Microbacterium resistens TaxID=156977 RepID=UPI001C59A537|nr:rhodanese-like domain-containing protein [Microbacterium resistens]MBW1641038.1 rhodanese-like domain-containing protein [Microbacterium resistens]